MARNATAPYHRPRSFNLYIMADKKPYTISQASDGIVTLTMAGLSENFKNKTVLKHFALQLAEETKNRMIGQFHLQDMPDGTLGIIMHKSGHIIKAKNYVQAVKLAEALYNDTI